MAFRKKHEKEAQKQRDEAKKNLKRARNSGDSNKIEDASAKAGRSNRLLKRIKKETRETDK